MRRTGFADLPLHGGKAPRWLFERMKKLARAIVSYFAAEGRTDDFLRRLSDPYWFQSFGCVLGFDWHSSGLTTTVMGALKEGLKDAGKDLGMFVAGGKGRVSLRTPGEIKMWAERVGFDPHPIVYASRMSAKVDSCALQDGFDIYHHVIVFTKDGKWTVVQQGMNVKLKAARRYHWLSDNLQSFVEEPHSAVVSEKNPKLVINLVAREADRARDVIAEVSSECPPEKVAKELSRIKERALSLPRRHRVLARDIDPARIYKILLKTYREKPRDFEKLLGIRGVGPKTLRALALVSELIYGAPVSFRDPARFSYAHGGKDGTPYPVAKAVYDETIRILEKAILQAKLSPTEKDRALYRLHRFYSEEDGWKGCM